jgi:hypothetical protein
MVPDGVRKPRIRILVESDLKAFLEDGYIYVSQAILNDPDLGVHLLLELARHAYMAHAYTGTDGFHVFLARLLAKIWRVYK